MSSTARLLIACPDARGIVATVTTFIADHGGNLLDAHQHTDAEHGEFFMRAEFDLAGCDLGRETFAAAWAPIADAAGMTWKVRWSQPVPRMAIMVGRQPHCLHDLVWRWQAGELPGEIVSVVSNHADLERIARHAGIPFHHVPIEGAPGSTEREAAKARQEEQVLALLERDAVEVVVLARYMQIVSPRFIAPYANRMINIHHSFLPAFAGGDPYRQAYDRGVKIIGATSHYVTDELDAGPIIAQETVHVSHRDSVDDLKRQGRDLERMVLARAVRAHLEDRVLASGGKTVVFE